MTFYAANRRDCWSFVAGKAPIDVKRAIWEHEKDELIHDDRMGRAHVTESDLQAGDESLLAPGAKSRFLRMALLRARKTVARRTGVFPILERRNNNAIVKGGGLVERWKRKQRAELGIKEAEKDFQTEVHAVADEDHSDIFEPVFARYVVSEAAAQAVLAATQDGLVIDRALRGALADAMSAVESVPDASDPSSPSCDRSTI